MQIRRPLMERQLNQYWREMRSRTFSLILELTEENKADVGVKVLSVPSLPNRALPRSSQLPKFSMQAAQKHECQGCHVRHYLGQCQSVAKKELIDIVGIPGKIRSSNRKENRLILVLSNRQAVSSKGKLHSAIRLVTSLISDFYMRKRKAF